MLNVRKFITDIFHILILTFCMKVRTKKRARASFQKIDFFNFFKFKINESNIRSAFEPTSISFTFSQTYDAWYII